MSLNSIKFESADIALLFKNSLIAISPDRQVAAVTSAEGKSKWLGGNKKQTLVVVRYPDVVHIPDKQLSFLTKLLAACNLDLDDVAILNLSCTQSSKMMKKCLKHWKPAPADIY